VEIQKLAKASPNGEKKMPAGSKSGPIIDKRLWRQEGKRDQMSKKKQICQVSNLFSLMLTDMCDVPGVFMSTVSLNSHLDKNTYA
jgi:hypothetical protein